MIMSNPRNGLAEVLSDPMFVRAVRLYYAKQARIKRINWTARYWRIKANRSQRRAPVLKIDLSKLSDEQVERLARGEDPLKVMGVVFWIEGKR